MSIPKTSFKQSAVLCVTPPERLIKTSPDTTDYTQMKKVTFESIVYLSILGSQLKIIHPDLLTVSRIETFAVRAMLRLGDVGKGVNAIAVDAQGLPVRRG